MRLLRRLVRVTLLLATTAVCFGAIWTLLVLLKPVVGSARAPAERSRLYATSATGTGMTVPGSWEERTMSDEVIEELWRIKDDMAREHGYDVARLAADLRGKQREDGRRIVDLHASQEAGRRRESSRRVP